MQLNQRFVLLHMAPHTYCRALKIIINILCLLIQLSLVKQFIYQIKQSLVGDLD